MLNLFFILFLFACDVILIEVLYRYLKIPTFYTRKLGHILGALISFWMIRVLNLDQFILVSLILIVINVFSKTFKFLGSIENLEEQNLGSILFPIAVLIVGILFWDYPIIYQGSVLILGLADSLGAIIGKTFGRHKVFRHSSKTWEGFFGFAVIALIVFYSVVYLEFSSVSLSSLTLITAASFILSFVEVLSPKGTDNFSITLLSSMVFYILIYQELSLSLI